jgi:hypothetical protein
VMGIGPAASETTRSKISLRTEKWIRLVGWTRALVDTAS